ncbi:MAG: sulfotransferase family protein [Bacteroidetes bacterium]|nr:MAG: sulfotransferase family protein [Bacteroidota bacterium]
MALSVIGAGFGRTGTMSIKMALEQLGLGPCHHMEEVFADPAQLPNWLAAANGQQVDWDDVFIGYNSTVDWPSAHYWRDLADVYPKSKILLSVRSADRWLESFSGTIKKILEIRNTIPDEYPRSVIDMAYKIIAEQTFGGAMNDKAVVLSEYQKRIDDVKQAIPADRLLIFDVTEGWAPLCEFLNLPIPDGDFPRSNSRNEFWEVFGGGSELD